MLQFDVLEYSDNKDTSNVHGTQMPQQRLANSLHGETKEIKKWTKYSGNKNKIRKDSFCFLI